MIKKSKRGKPFYIFTLIFVLLMVWMVPSSVLPVGAVTQLDVKYRFNVEENAHELYWNAALQPGRIQYSYHDATGTLIEPPDETEPDEPGNANSVYRYVSENGQWKVILRLPLVPDHIFDVTIQVFSDAPETQTGEAKLYVLTEMTYEVESFDQMANTLVETLPLLEDMDGNSVDYPGPASKVISGQNPKIRLRWKVPTVYSDPDPDLGMAGIQYITQYAADAAWKTALQKNTAAPLPILESGFYFSMNKGRNTTAIMEFKTYYNGNVLTMGGATIGSLPPIVDGLDGNGIPTVASEGFASVILQKSNGIESGTEYQNMKMGITLSTTANAPLLFINTALAVGKANAFLGLNTDIAFQDYGALSSVFTPMEYELTKVDVDKVEVKFRKVTNGIYTKLFYEIQDLTGNELNFPNDPDNKGNWVTIPDSSLPGGQLYGSVIIPFQVVNGQLPDKYIRVICSEEGAVLPRNSTLANSLTLLGSQTGRPSLPQNITVTAKYDGLKTVTVNGIPVEIPTSKLVITFDKPLIWTTHNGAGWTTFKDAVYDTTDPVYHILLSTLLPDVPDVGIVDRNVILQDAVNTVTVTEPVRQKRTLVIGKKQLFEPDGDPNRLSCELDGTLLFMDLASDPEVSLTAISSGGTGENNETGTRGPYPEFLLPNTTYYLQTFTSRQGDLEAINEAVWADRGTGGDGLPSALNQVISYTSPIYTFTTYPIREVPVPLPNIALSVDPVVSADPITGKMTLNGIDVTYNHILKEIDWKRYLSTDQWNLYNSRELNTLGERKVSLSVEYRFFISKVPPTSESDFINAGSETVEYPTLLAAPVRHIKSIPDADPEVDPDPGSTKILPNTTYYIKAHPYLLVTEWPEGDPAATVTSLGNTLDTAVKSITTPKLDIVSLDNITRNPRAPSEFSVASDASGLPILTDASVVMQWMHREEDVGYEMIVTSVVPDSDANPDELASDPQLIDFLAEYRAKTPDLVDGNVIYIPLNDADARIEMEEELDLSLNDSTLAVLFPMDGFLEPNTQYYFSLRAVRKRGTLDPVTNLQSPPPSRWITIPVTTPTVKSPEQFEALRDIEIGFSVISDLPKGDPSNFEVYMKKTVEPDTSYKVLSRDKYTLVRQANTYYWRISGLQSDTWYDFRLRHIPPDAKWYDASAVNPAAAWVDSPAAPITRNTRDALHEIEVRWEGEDAYRYFLEARSEDEVDYTKLTYSASGISDIGFEDSDGNRTEFYQERTNAQVVSNPNRYMVYARISRKMTLQRDGTLQQMPLVTNKTYFVKLWARNPSVVIDSTDTVNKADSIHVGPVTTRTDFSQADYDIEKDRENIVALYESEAESLSEKPYWVIDQKAGNAVRVLLKGDRVEAMIESNPTSTQTIALEKENDNAVLYEITIPQQVLDTIHRVDGKLGLRVGGAEYVISRSTFYLPTIKAKVATSQVKETMLRIRIERKDNPDTAVPTAYKTVSKTYRVSAEAIGSKYAKGIIDGMVYDILQNPNAIGPFKYGLLDLERNALDKNATDFTYRIHTDLLDTVGGLVTKVEGEMSRYLKDILDGGSGVAPFSIQKAQVSEYPGGILARISYNYDSGRILPYTLKSGTSTWKEPAGMRAYTDSQVSFRIDSPSANVIVSTKNVQGVSGVTWPGLTAIAGKYDLTYVFGVKPIYPTNTVNGKDAVLLYELLTDSTETGQGLSMSQKIAETGLADVVQTRTLLTPFDNQRAVAWSVHLYSNGSGIPVSSLKPVKTPAIANLAKVLPALQKPVIIGLDMNLAKLDSKQMFDSTGKSNLGSMMEMAQRVLSILGK